MARGQSSQSRLQAHKMNESTESARVPGMTPLLAGSLPESLPAKALPGEWAAVLVVASSKQA